MFRIVDKFDQLLIYYVCLAFDMDRRLANAGK